MTDVVRNQLEKIVKYDHQGMAQELLRCSPSGVTHRLAAFEGFIKYVAQTDIQHWARTALEEVNRK